ncbi:hypothetical protein Tco_0343302 [Tanacetum coccineum]
MNEQSHYKQDQTKTRQSINVKSHIFNVREDNDKSKQTPTRMSSVVQRSLKKETSTLGEIVSLNYIKSNKNNTCNNDKNLSEIQLEHKKEDELVAVMVNVVHELGCMMVVKEIENGLLKEVEKLEWWFEQDIDDEGEEDEEDEGGGEV